MEKKVGNSLKKAEKIESIVLATENKGKYREFSLLAEPYPLALKSLWEQSAWKNAKKSTHELESHSSNTSYTDNARSKAQATYKMLQTNTLADDSGLEIDCLGGEPGIRSANYIAMGPGDNYQNTVLPFLLEKMAGEKNRKAHFICSLVLCLDNREIEAKGVCEGAIGESIVGSQGFGYDPIFFPKEYSGKSMAQLSLSEKNTISHRALAFKNLMLTLIEQKLI